MGILRSWKWRIRLHIHYWFGNGDIINYDWDIQTGDYISGRKLLPETDIKRLFTNQITETLYSLHGEIIDRNGVSLIHNTPIPSSNDPLAQIGSWAWKSTIRIHTRKSWQKYQKSLLHRTIKWSR